MGREALGDDASTCLSLFPSPPKTCNILTALTDAFPVVAGTCRHPQTPSVRAQSGSQSTHGRAGHPPPAPAPRPQHPATIAKPPDPAEGRRGLEQVTRFMLPCQMLADPFQAVPVHVPSSPFLARRPALSPEPRPVAMSPLAYGSCDVPRRHGPRAGLPF